MRRSFHSEPLQKKKSIFLFYSLSYFSKISLFIRIVFLELKLNFKSNNKNYNKLYESSMNLYNV